MVAKLSPVPRAPRLPSLAKYELLGELGHGGMATVYRAHDPRLGRDVAVKLLHAHLRESAEVAARFATEARAVAKLRHPNIVEVFDVSGDDDGEQFLVVELVRGPSMRRLLAEHGALPPEVGCAIVLDVLNALASAHDAGVVHRDVKPENVLIEHRAARDDLEGAASAELPGHRVRVKLTDFGIAKLLDVQGVTSTGQVLGSPAHMAPEQIDGSDVDERADVFGAGVLLYECLVGHLPFEGQNPAQVLRRVLDGLYATAEAERPVVGKALSAICDRALARSPDDRYPTVRAMRDALVAELARLDFGEPRVELEAWLDDPEGYEVRHAAKMVERLCALGAEGRRRGDVLAATADYNRALAFAPHDGQLLRVVTGLQRRSKRLAFARRLAPMLLVAVCVGATAFGATRRLRRHPPPQPITVVAPLSVAPPSASAPPPSPPATELVAPSALAPRTPARPTVVASRPPPPKTRAITFARLLPVAGVLVAVDGSPAGPASTDRVLTVDEKAHELTFSCAQDMCLPERRFLAAGEAPERLVVSLKIRDARLTVNGDPRRTYGIVSRPGLTFRAGSVVSVAMSTGAAPFRVIELETQRVTPVYLKSGQLVTANFGPE